MEFIKKYKIGIWIFGVAVVVRLLLLWANVQASGSLDATIHGQDGYYDIARNIFDGDGFSWDGVHPSPFHVPIYPGLLALSLFIFNSFVPVALFQLILSAGIPLLVLRLAGKFTSSRKIALISAWIIALEPNFIYHSFIFYTETVFIFIFLVFLLVFIRYFETKALKTLCLSAILLGLAALTKTSAQYMPVFLVPLAWWVLRKDLSWRTLARNSAIFVGIFLVVLSPWLYRNYKTFGTAGMTVIPTYNLYTCVVPSVLATVNNTSFAIEFQKFINDRKIDIGSVLDFRTEAAFSREAKDIIFAHPKAFIEVSLINVFTFLTHDGALTVLGNAGIQPKVGFSRPALSYLLSEPIQFAREASGFFLSPFVLVFILRLFWIFIAIMFFVGVWKLWRKKGITPAIALGLILVLYFVATTPSNGLTVNARFRMPIEPIMVVVALMGVASIKKPREIESHTA